MQTAQTVYDLTIYKAFKLNRVCFRVNVLTFERLRNYILFLPTVFLDIKSSPLKIDK